MKDFHKEYLSVILLLELIGRLKIYPFIVRMDAWNFTVRKLKIGKYK
jgi:hypothetical protein